MLLEWFFTIQSAVGREAVWRGWADVSTFLPYTLLSKGITKFLEFPSIQYLDLEMKERAFEPFEMPACWRKSVLVIFQNFFSCLCVYILLSQLAQNQLLYKDKPWTSHSSCARIKSSSDINTQSTHFLIARELTCEEKLPASPEVKPNLSPLNQCCASRLPNLSY